MKGENMNKDIPIFSLQRLPVYLNFLRSLPAEDNGGYISSGAIAQALKLGEVLVRKDLAYTSCVGKPKLGYRREDLIAALEEFLCCNNKKSAIIVGAGGLGHALLSYNGFAHYGIEIAAAFDNDSQKVGTQIAGKQIYDVSEMERVVKESGATLAIIAVPALHAQNTANNIVKSGIKAILNFAPVQLNLNDEIKVINMDVAANLAVLASML
jgi:redox-sensing transcriptional repressor